MRLFTALVSAFCAVTVCWIAWALETPGDEFANGSPLAAITLPMAALAGAIVGWKAKARMRVIIAFCSVASLCFFGCSSRLAGGHTHCISNWDSAMLRDHRAEVARCGR